MQENHWAEGAIAPNSAIIICAPAVSAAIIKGFTSLQLALLVYPVIALNL